MAGTSYTRQSTITDGNLITASLFNNEYNQLLNAFVYSSTGTTGHTHDGTAGQGGAIGKIGDQDFNNKIEISATNNRIECYIEVGGSPVEQLRIQDGAIVPVTDSDIDFGTTSLRFKDAFVDSLTVTGVVTATGFTIGSAVITEAELEILDGKTFLDEDDLSSDSATGIPSQQSVKAYVDAQVTAQDLDLTDGTTSISIDLDSEALSVLGGTGITSTASGNGVTLAIDSTVATLTGSQTLTNKTLTSPDVNTPDIDGGTIDGAIIGGTTAAAGSFTTVDATGNITVGGTVDGRDVAADGTKLDGIETAATSDQTDAEIRAAVEAATDSNVFTDADHSKLNAIEALADVTDTANVTAAGALMDSELTSIASVKALNQGVATTDSPTFAGLTASGEITANGGIALGDGDVATFGDSDDLSIQHLAGTTYLTNTTGSLVLRTDSFRVLNTANSEQILHGDANGAVTAYYDNAVKLATTATGIDVTGEITADALTINSSGVQIGTVLQSTSTTSARLALMDANTTAVSQVGIGATGNTLGLYAAGGAPKVVVSATGIDVTGNITVGNNDTIIAENNIRFKPTGAVYIDHNTVGQVINFRLSNASSLDKTAMTLTSAGNVGIGTSSPSEKLHIQGDGADILLTDAAGGQTAKLGATGSNNGLLELNNSAHVGTVFLTSSGDSYFNGGNVGIGTSSPQQLAHINGTGISYFRATGGTGNTGIDFGQHSNGNGYIWHRDSAAVILGTASTERMRIDFSGNVGIGTSSPVNNVNKKTLALQGAWGGQLDIMVGSTVHAQFGTDNFSSGQSCRIQSQDGIVFKAGGPTERMRIDSSGNLMVGTTSTAVSSSTGSVTGAVINNSGLFEAAKTGTVMELNRLTADGTILNFRKDGATVGSIGTEVGGLYIADAGVGFRFDSGGTDDIIPCNATGGAADASINLGSSGARFKDLYLSGNISAGTGGANANNYQIKVSAGTTGLSRFIAADTSDAGYIDYEHSSDSWIHRTAGAERMRIDSSGNLLIGKTTTGVSGAGTVIRAGGELFVTRAGDVMNLNRLTSDGEIAVFRKDGAAVGSIGTISADLEIHSSTAGHVGLRFANGGIFPTNNTGTVTDGAADVGNGSFRFNDIYATNGTIQTSDRNEKQDIAELSDAEQRVAVACKGLLRKFRWKDSVAEKGDEARIHFGIIAQDLQAAFAAEGLDAGDYAMFISTTWTDEETNEEKTRLGVRYSELLAFIISAL